MSVYTYVYINTNTCMYIFDKVMYIYISNIFRCNIKIIIYMYINVNMFKNILCVCIYIHNK